MKAIPNVRIKRATLEAVDADCPHCDYPNTFNRITDLKDLTPISYKEVLCDKCKKRFPIGGDNVIPVWHWLIRDCFELKEDKRFRHYCALNLCQAFEAFFFLYLKVIFLFRPYRVDHDTKKSNEMEELLYENTKQHTFPKMRKLFLHYVLANRKFSTWEEVRSEISLISKNRKLPKDEFIDQHSDPKLSKLLKELKGVRAPCLRNKVVHKHVKLPTVEEIDLVETETETLLDSLSSHLGIYGDDPNHYMNEPN